MAKNFTIDYSAFEKKAKALARNLGKDEREFVRQQTGILAREVAKYTPPYVNFPGVKGTSVGTAKDIKQGQWAIYNDLRRIFAPIADDVAEKQRRHSKGGPVYRRGVIVAPAVMSTMSSMSDFHHRHRNTRGRTIKIPVGGVPWVGETLFTAYVIRQQKKAGMAKAEFAKASLALGAKGAIVKGIKRHIGTASGTGRIIKESKGSKGIITGRSAGLAHTIRHIPMIQKNRLVKAVKRGEFLMRKVAKDANFKVV